MPHNELQGWYSIWPSKTIGPMAPILRYGLLDQFSTSCFWRPLEANEASEFISFLYHQINEELNFKIYKSNDLVPVIVTDILAFYHDG